MYRKIVKLPKTSREVELTRNTIRAWYAEGYSIQILSEYFIYYSPKLIEVIVNSGNKPTPKNPKCPGCKGKLRGKQKTCSPRCRTYISRKGQ